MISEEEMETCKGKNIRIFFVDGDVLEDKCLQFHHSEDDDEEATLELSEIFVDQSEIERIEVLD